MNPNQFRQIIKTEYGYQSPERRLFLAHHLPGWRIFIYYARISTTFLIENLAGLRGKLNNERWLTASIRCIKAVESAGGCINVSGLEGVSNHNGPLVYIANHMSILETLILPSVTLAFSDVTFIIKDELRHYPIIGRVMKGFNLIAVYRQNPRDDLKIVLNEGHNRIRQGCSVVIFPQATRSRVFDEAIFNTLGVKLARKAGVPVVPIALKTDFHGNGRWIKDIGPINPNLALYFKATCGGIYHPKSKTMGRRGSLKSRLIVSGNWLLVTVFWLVAAAAKARRRPETCHPIPDTQYPTPTIWLTRLLILVNFAKI
jgi:1-acyl-sn-glycerol-3-phosphate acyltransferase